ncbi:unnamed protein product [Symbiodinium pilosum]|uniref:Uncharacterized protein n=1 Tax=Symbiodinium pilosum TaxID=2952 RepID=A0A812K5M3_SYMPI|nr:unnamed protein product [Symbiodinium pilosum]
MNNTGISHFVLGLRPPHGAYQVDIYLLYWNRSDHLSERQRSGVPLKNIGYTAAAEWARVGRGGSNRQPLFRESAVTHRPHHWQGAAAAAGMTALISTALLAIILRRL